MLKTLLLSILVPTCIACGGELLAKQPPPVAREFRAAWIATVANIDWPSKPGLPAAEQRRELVALLDLARHLRLNAVVLQVRPACDALYASPIEPWSEYLTGAQGQPPEDGYDPLEFAVAEAHRRGIELHAWFNPYRAGHTTAKSEPSPDHVSRKHPEWVREYGKQLWLDPGVPAAADHTVSVIMDVVERYDVDGVHFDDYFYPYPISEEEQVVPFPDDASYRAAEQLSSVRPFPDRDDWRRENVNRLIQRLDHAIHEAKPHVRFGVSPFGIWRPGHPPQIKGFDQYALLYADARKWLREGWVDYLSPQLYWPIDQEPQSFPVLLDWWREQNRVDRHIWPGLYTSKVLAEGKGWPIEEITNQIALTRRSTGSAATGSTESTEAPGHIHFSIKALAENRSGLADLLRDEVYRSPALPPATPWRELAENERASHWRPIATASAKEGATQLSLGLEGDAEPWLWVVQWKTAGEWTTQITPGAERSFSIPLPKTDLTDLTVRPVDRLGALGPDVRPVERD